MINKIYEYIKTGNKYLVIGEALMKNPATRDWNDCVIYKQMIDENPLTFVREKKEFLERFKLIDDNER